jgi:hypothetical protein
MKFLDNIQLVATGSIETPPAGFIVMYMNTDGLLYIKDANGTQTRIS